MNWQKKKQTQVYTHDEDGKETEKVGGVKGRDAEGKKG